MNLAWLRRLVFLALGILLVVLVRTSDISPVPAIAVLALATYDIFQGLRGPKRSPDG